ncbi:hypothetical protein [Candidatus Protochlamydia phocaeensis]|uniref:hypothetical protein n=1 Tax=Candidatus Protochlamydia phocaeensis TaxID=1414722 RepID=UPI0008396E39|nr:hypothetical protein [Candidatus Protochlamydia phocaeensis]
MKKIIQWTIGFVLGCLPWHLQGLNFIIQDLGTLTADESYATAINNQNAVVGYAKTGDQVSDFIWQLDSGLTLLPFSSSYQLPLINNHNQVACLFWHRTNYWFFTNKRTKHVYIFNPDGSYQDIGAPKQWKMQELEDWQQSSGWDNKELKILTINDKQQILLANSHDLNKATQFAIWQNGVFQDVDPNFISTAYSMNNQGLILGRRWIKDDNSNIPMLVLYDPAQGTVTDIMKDVNIARRELNDQGQVIIFQSIKNQSIYKGFLWDPQQGLIALEDFAPLAINNCNQIIGFQISELQSQKIVSLLWNQGEIIPLNLLIGLDQAESLWSEIEFLTGINDNGYIIGQGQFDGKRHAFVLIPSGD